MKSFCMKTWMRLADFSLLLNSKKFKSFLLRRFQLKIEGGKIIQFLQFLILFTQWYTILQQVKSKWIETLWNLLWNKFITSTAFIMKMLTNTEITSSKNKLNMQKSSKRKWLKNKKKYIKRSFNNKLKKMN